MKARTKKKLREIAALSFMILMLLSLFSSVIIGILSN